MDKKMMNYKANVWLWRFFAKRPSLLNRMKKLLPHVADRIKKNMIPEGDGIYCLPDSKFIQVDEEIQMEETVMPTEVLEHFVEKSNYRAIMNSCICRDAEEGCQDYPNDLGCLFLGEAAREIHPDLCRPATKDEAREQLHRYRDAGLITIVGRAKFDALVFGATPHEKFLTICGCCPCCCITRTMPYVPENLSEIFHKMPGVEVRISDDCVGCGECLDECIYDGIELVGDKAVNTDSCRACGRCARVCPNDSIEIVITDDSYVQQTIDMIAPNVDVT